MTRYFSREEAEALLPAITPVLLRLQESRKRMHALEEDLAILRAQAMGNGHHLHERIAKLQQTLVNQVEILRGDLEALQAFGCELKDIETGLIDFLSLRDGQEVYLCWRLGEEHIAFWHPLHTGIAGREPLE